MLAEVFNLLLGWIQLHPHWAYLVVFLVAAGESLVVVGLILPGVALMFGAGALVAAGAMELGPTLVAAAAGAVCGDGASFWIGRHYHERLRAVWPFSRHAALIDRGVDFFRSHGGKSVVLARFFGPVRPILPAVAGMLDMPARRFVAVNVFSALLWAPAYTLPGVVFGASLGLAAEVAGRLAALLLLVVSLAWFSLWLVRLLFRLLQPRAARLLAGVLAWSRAHPRLEPLAAAVLDPARPEARGLAVLLAALAVSSIALAWLAGGLLAGLDLYLEAALRELRTPVADRALAFATGLGDARVVLAVLGAGGLWLAGRRRGHAAVHWLSTVASAIVLTSLLGLAAAHRATGVDVLGRPDGFGTPSDHVSLGVATYGFLAVLVARELAPARRWMPYVGAALAVLAIAFSRLYLGAHRLSDVLAGLGVGLACVALFGLAYRRHPARPLGWPSLLAVAAAALVATGAWWAARGVPAELARLAPSSPTRSLAAGRWWTQNWRALPEQRRDLRVKDRQPLNVQLAGDLAGAWRVLAARGWRVPPGLSTTTALRWLSPRPVIDALPVLPQVNDGVHDVLRLVKADGDGHRLLVLRLWTTPWRLEPNAAPVWVGSVGELGLARHLHLISYLAGAGPGTEALPALRADLAACDTAVRLRPASGTAVLLVRGCPATLAQAGAAPAARTLSSTSRKPARSGPGGPSRVATASAKWAPASLTAR